MTEADDSPATCAQPSFPAYRRGCRCVGCRAANTAYYQAAKERRLARAAQADFKHGAGGYKNWNCRCPICTKGNTEAGRPHLQRLRAKPSGREAPNGYARWEPHETQLLLTSGLPIAEIALQLGRSYNAVAMKRSALRNQKETTDADA